MVRISDIAKKLNLSEATVSNAFTGKGRMKEETRNAILACAEEMGYQVRTRKHSGDRKHLIAVAEGLGSNFVTSILSGISEEAAKLGITVPVYSLRINDGAALRKPDLKELERKVQNLLSSIESEVSGIIYISQYARRMDGVLNSLSIPIIFVFCSREDGKAFVHYDDHQGAYLAVNALLAEGRKKIAMISGPIDSIGMYLRSSGYQQALVEHRLPYDPRLVRIGDWDVDSGYEQTKKLLAEGQQIDAIFAQNDFIGLGAARALRENGLRVPEDISVIGFDDSIPCRLAEPQLTSIRPPFDELGRTALTRLLAQLDGNEEAAFSNELIPCELVKRESTL